MKNRILAILVVGLLAAPMAAHAIVTYDFSASNFYQSGGTPGIAAPYDPISGSFALDGSSLVAFELTIGSVSFGLGDVGLNSADSYIYGGPDGNVGADTNDFLLRFNPTTIAFSEFLYSYKGYFAIWTAGTGTITERTDVPEPSTLALFGLGLAGLGLARRRKLN